MGERVIAATAAEDRIATLTWLADALEDALSQGQTGAMTYLEAVLEDVEFEIKISSRHA
jgi:hypothetical protein